MELDPDLAEFAPYRVYATNLFKARATVHLMETDYVQTLADIFDRFDSAKQEIRLSVIVSADSVSEASMLAVLVMDPSFVEALQAKTRLDFERKDVDGVKVRDKTVQFGKSVVHKTG